MEVTLTIDGKTVRVRHGAMILEAARAAGAEIPTLCHDDGLRPYGGCRICMIELEGTPRRMVPACMTPVSDGMSVVTGSAAVLAARRQVLELLLINHPLDCPVCDKAGECRLQDLVHEYGLGPGSFSEEKRKFPTDYVSPFLERNHNRCILCGKCVRACTERCGVGVLTFALRGGKTRVTTAFDKPLDCEFCGECLEICPVGALTAKQSKYKARPWNVEQVHSTCMYCGCGCPVIFERRDGRITRARSDDGHYLCVKGRFAWDAVLHESRLAGPKMRVNGALVDCTWDDALTAVASNLRKILRSSGADSIGGLGSTRTTNEDNYIFQKFMRTVLGTNNIDLLARSLLPYGLNSRYFSGELAALAEHDVILLLDNDAGAVNALTGIEIVRAVNRFGCKLILADSGASKFTRLAAVVIEQEPSWTLMSLIVGMKDPGKIAPSPYPLPSGERTKVRGGREDTDIRRAVEMLRAANNVALVLPAGAGPDTIALVNELASLLMRVTYYPLVMRGNIQGALDMGVMPRFFPGYRPEDPDSVRYFAHLWNGPVPQTPGKSALEMLSGIENGRISALYIMGDDPAASMPGAAASLKRLKFLVVQDIFLTETAKMANVVLPAASFVEKTGTMTTIERRLRQLNEVISPFAEARSDHEIISMVASQMGTPMAPCSEQEIMKEIRSCVPMYEQLGIGQIWQSEKSPLNNAIVDISLRSDKKYPCPPTPLDNDDPLPLSLSPRGRGAGVRVGSAADEQRTEKPSLFSSGMMTTRSGELRAIKTT